MTIPDTEEFKHLTSNIFGDGSPIQLYCSQAKVNTHRKLKAKLKSSIESGTDLEYTDPETNASAMLSEDDIFEINALSSFKNAMQNETGPKINYRLDITKYSREDFLTYLDGTYDPENPDKYDSIKAYKSFHVKIQRLHMGLQQSLMAIHGNTEVDQTAPIISSILLAISTPINYDHNLLSDLEELLNLLGEYNGDKKMLVVLLKMVSDYFLEHKAIISFEKPDVILRNLLLVVLGEVTHSNVCDLTSNTILRSAIEQTSYKYDTPLPGINYPNINDDDEILTHAPTCNPGEQIATTKAHPTDETPASKTGINCNNKNGINCNNGLGTGHKRRGTNVRESSSHVNGECAISTIQRMGRGYILRSHLAPINTIQRMGRGYILRSHLARLTNNINIIQRIWRGSRTRHNLAATTRVLIRPGVDPNSNDYNGEFLSNSTDYNGESLSHAPPYGSFPIVTLAPILRVRTETGRMGRSRLVGG